MDSVQSVVVGAGVVGLAVARELARSGREVVVLESAGAIGTETSSHNSEVIHAGLYYEPGSLKAVLCLDGRQRLTQFCLERGVAYRNTGKLIVAADVPQEAALSKIESRALAAGVSDLRWLDRRAAQELEPALASHCALHSPSTGIIDSHGLMLALLGDATDHGAVIAFRSALTGGEVLPGGFEIEVGSNGLSTRLRCRELVNAAGLGAWAVASSLSGLPGAAVPPRYLAKGSYFTLSRRSPFSRLVYPIPTEAGLGVHLTLDLAGQARFGPDVEWVSHVDYRIDPQRAKQFYPAIRQYWPGLLDGALAPAYAGVRPKIAGPGEPAADFRIDGPQIHGAPGLVNLFGIESPGLTASLAIADRVRAELDRVR